jgi:hypothetical protein
MLSKATLLTKEIWAKVDVWHVLGAIYQCCNLARFLGVIFTSKLTQFGAS